jgi:hypothetical protein
MAGEAETASIKSQQEKCRIWRESVVSNVWVTANLSQLIAISHNGSELDAYIDNRNPVCYYIGKWEAVFWVK